MSDVKHTPGDPVEQGEPVYYARGGKVWKSPVRHRKEGGSSIQLGFPVCAMTEAAGEENAEVVAALMNRGDVADELLAALKDLLALCENSSFENGVTDQSGRDEGDCLAGEMIDRARAAITRASRAGGE